jgi:hypothetical protein
MRRKPHLVDQVEHEIDERTAPPRPGDRKYASRDRGDDPAALRAEQEDELAHGPLEGGGFFLSTGQWKGLLLGGLIGAVVGAVVLLPLALVPFMEPASARVAVVCLAGALAGAAAGGVYWGGRTPELEGETLDVDGRPSDGTTLRDAGTDERGR